jgi:hypothetical protein
LFLEDPEGSKLMATRIDNAAITLAVELAGPGAFRMFEEDRRRLAEFLAGPLEG